MYMKASGLAAAVESKPLGPSMTAFANFVGDPTEEARELIIQHAQNVGIGGAAVKFYTDSRLGERRLETYVAATKEGMANIAHLGALTVQGEDEVIPVEGGDNSTLVVITGFGDVALLQLDETQGILHSN